LRRDISFLIVILALMNVVACTQESRPAPEPEAMTPAAPAAGPDETGIKIAQPTEVALTEEPAPKVIEEREVKPAVEAVEAGATVEQLVARLDGLTIDDFFDRSFELILLRRPQWITALGLEDTFGIRNDRLTSLT